MAKKMEAVGRLAGGVAHDFNNLLMVIDTNTTFAMDGLRPEDPLREDLEEVHRACDRAAGLTRQLLAFSRRQILQPVRVDLDALVSGMERMLRRLIGEDVDLLVVTTAGLWHTRADPGQIEQVIMNLAVNARDAMPDGGRLTIETTNVEMDEVYVAAHPAARPGQYVLLSVTDNGCGMDAPTRSRLFEPFFTTKEMGKGTGLGLATIYGIVKQSGGYIWVYSEIDQGTTFKVYLPRDTMGAVATATPSTPASPATGTETVLVVEDEEAVRNLTRRVLAAAGYRVHTAANAGEALLACERLQFRVDLMLTDVVMPGMSGRSLAVRLGRVCPGLKVLYMSGYTDNAIVHHGVLDPGTWFISKPFNAEDLGRKVRQVLDSGSQG
jgi:two-component system, cell cycle sensor histidine kinase and response regulator CckA